MTKTRIVTPPHLDPHEEMAWHFGIVWSLLPVVTNPEAPHGWVTDDSPTRLHRHAMLLGHFGRLALGQQELV